MIDEVVLVEAADDEGFEVTDQIEVSKFLKRKVGQTRCYFFQCLRGKAVGESID